MIDLEQLRLHIYFYYLTHPYHIIVRMYVRMLTDVYYTIIGRYKTYGRVKGLNERDKGQMIHTPSSGGHLMYCRPCSVMKLTMLM